MCFLALASDIGLLINNTWFSPDVMKFLTIWGLCLSMVTFLVGLVMHLERENVSWKIFMVLFEMCFALEVIITLGFWVALWKPMSVMEEFKPVPKKLGLILDHSLPLFCLGVDYSINQVPFVKMHHWILSLICIVYLIINLLVTKISGVPVYPPMKWDTFFAFVTALALWIVPLLSFFMLWKFDERVKQPNIQRREKLSQ